MRYADLGVRLGKIYQLQARCARKREQIRDRATENHRLFLIGTARALLFGTDPMVGFGKVNAKGLPMFSIASVRETATIFAGAFVSALLLVSAATSLPIA